MSFYHEKVALVTGANRGLGKAIVAALLAAGIKKVYAAARCSSSIKHADTRVVPIDCDITSVEQLERVKTQVGDLNILINNAGRNAFGSILTSELDGIQQDMAVNYLGTLNAIRALYPVIQANEQGHIVNVISICALASMPGLGGYCASKAALFSATQAIRAELKKVNVRVRVQGVIAGPLDTDMNEGLEIEMATPEVAAQAIVAGIQLADDEIYIDPVALESGRIWQRNPKQLEADFALFE
ncbi:SDR family NAD(P)-dependent oxidoreductase [Algibacillus agarilyticus]|uniref:SDR family NAD(P)-dependent oxidoreductase n=1 Tax=Algibacillus agarilyticus TaxID=2234133 RepID=UPI000DD087E9|nr:SDR family NAD(P)-dependent oxidoreductase [Algibacillus agarilyticus]